MAKKSKFVLRNGKSTGYAVVYHVVDKGWGVLRRVTKLEAKEAMNIMTQLPEYEEVAILHVEYTWQRSTFDDEAL